MADALHPVGTDDDGEWEFSRTVSLLGVTPGPVGTFAFDPRGNLAAAWRQWRDGLFAPLLAPFFVESYGCGIASRIIEVTDLDLDLDSRLSDTVRSRSVGAARTFLEGKEEMRGNKEWKKFSTHVEGGKSPGHLPIVFALQTALYHLPLAPALASYAWFEFRSRHREAAQIDPTESEQAIFETALPAITSLLAAPEDQSSNDFGNLKAL